MKADRLLRLAALLEMDAANPTGVKFDLSTWAAKDGYNENNMSTQNEPFMFETNTKTVPVDCGTVACAVGLAAISGIFAAEGFGWMIQSNEGGKGALIPTFGGDRAFNAVEAFFELDYKSSNALFTSEGYDGLPKTGAEGELAVAKKIREFVADNGMT